MGTVDSLRARVGQQIGVSPWAAVDQALVDRHAEATGDAQWIHNDPVRAAAEGPFGGPIVQGFLLLALFTGLAGEVLAGEDDFAYLVNYGFDRIRFVRPVPVGARVRLRLGLADVRERDDGGVVVSLDAMLEREGQREPAVVARWLFLAGGTTSAG